MDAVKQIPDPPDDPARDYASGSAERFLLENELKRLAQGAAPLTMTVAGAQLLGGGARTDVVQPHHRAARLGVFGAATREEAVRAADAALEAGAGWRALAFEDRAAVLLRAADLLTGPWRERVVAATMLGQSTTADLADADVRALAGHWRRAVGLGLRLLADQPAPGAGGWRRADHRPLEGFVLARTPACSTAAAGAAPTVPALLGNTVVWQPAPAQTLSAWHLVRLLEEAGLPPGVVNMITGDGARLPDVLLRHRDLAGVAVEGPSAAFRELWRTVGEHLAEYRSRPRLAGPAAGGGGFVVAHRSADPAVLGAVLLDGAFTHQGQRPAAVARAHVPRGVWRRIEAELVAESDAMAVGDVTDPCTAMGALVDAAAFERTRAAVERARQDPRADIVAGGRLDDAIGWFARPTVVVCTDPRHELLSARVPGPLLAVHVYEDSRWEEVLELVSSGPRAPAGAVVAGDRAAVAQATAALRFATDGLAVNAVPAAGPGGAAGSGAGDPAPRDLVRWTSTRAVTEIFLTPAGSGRSTRV